MNSQSIIFAHELQSHARPVVPVRNCEFDIPQPYRSAVWRLYSSPVSKHPFERAACEPHFEFISKKLIALTANTFMKNRSFGECSKCSGEDVFAGELASF